MNRPGVQQMVVGVILFVLSFLLAFMCTKNEAMNLWFGAMSIFTGIASLCYLVVGGANYFF